MKCEQIYFSQQFRHIKIRLAHLILFFFDIYFSPSQTELVLSWIYIYFIFYSCNRQVAANGWSEGEYNGKAGWFPSAYVERQEKAPASKLLEESPKP